MESEGIKVVIATSNDNAVGIFGVSNGLVSYDIFVKEEDREKSIELLKMR